MKQRAGKHMRCGSPCVVAALFGYIVQSGEQIKRVVIGGAGTAYDNKNHFVDDFGIAPLPEPKSVVMAGVAAAILIAGRRMLRG
jgi:hypothetical protein